MSDRVEIKVTEGMKELRELLHSLGYLNSSYFDHERWQRDFPYVVIYQSGHYGGNLNHKHEEALRGEWPACGTPPEILDWANERRGCWR